MATGPSRPTLPVLDPRRCRGVRRAARRATSALPGRARHPSAPCSAATRSAATWRWSSRSTIPSACRGWSSPVRRDSSSAASPAACPTSGPRPSCASKMEEIFYDPRAGHAGWVECRAPGRHDSRLGPARPAVARAASATISRRGWARSGCPTLLVWGKDDRITPPEVAERFRALIPDAAALALSPTAATPRCSSSRRPSRRAWRTGSSETRRRREVAVPRGGAAVIARVGGALLDWAAGRRRRRAGARQARARPACRSATLRRPTATARDTEFGLAHGFASHPLRGRLPGAGAAARLPRLRPRAGGARWPAEPDVTWPGRPPVLGEDLGDHRRRQGDPGHAGGVRRAPPRRLGRAADGRGACRAAAAAGRTDAVPGRQHALQPARARGRASATSPGWWRAACRRAFAGRYSPGPAIAAHPRLGDAPRGRGGARVERQDLRLLAGMPSWMLILLRARRAHAGRRRPAASGPRRAAGPTCASSSTAACRSRPIAACSRQWLGRRLECVEVYPGSEGFVARADRAERRPHPHARLRHLLRVRAGRGSGPPSARGGTRWPTSSWTAPTRWC